MEPRIGVIDSGAGGLTLLVRLVELMPYQPFLYFADSAWCPYGPRPQGELQVRLARIVEYLLARGCTLVVLACNTATAAAIEYLRATYNVPFVGMEPAVKPAALHSQSGHIGVLATQGTVAGGHFRRTSLLYSTRAQIHFVVGEGLVQLVEGGQYDTPLTRQTLQRLLEPLLERSIDHLVLGCTHYPFLLSALRSVLPKGIVVVDPAPAVAMQAVRIFRSFSPVFPIVEEGEDVRLQLLSSGDAAPLASHLRYYAACCGVAIPFFSLRSGVL